jgi:hypothetical protein
MNTLKSLLLQYMESVTVGKSVQSRFFCGERRKQKNIERVAVDQSMTYAVMRGVIADHRVVEALVKVTDFERSIILCVEAKLGRKLSRDRAQALIDSFLRARNARNRKVDVTLVPGLHSLNLATFAQPAVYH